MPLNTPSAAAVPTKPSREERVRAFVDKLAATLDPDFPSTFALDNQAPVIADDSASYGTEAGGRPAFVVEDDAAWRG